jgi:O-antigen ligase/TPR repeat protein
MEEKFKKILNFSIVFLCIIVPVIFNPKLENVFELFKINVLKIVIFLIFAIYLFVSIYKREIKIPENPILIPLTIYIFISSISTIFSYQKNLSYNELINNFTYFLLLFLIISFYEKEKNYLIFTAISISSAFVSIYALLQHLRIDFIEWNSEVVYIRSTSTLGNPDFVSAYLSLTLPILLSFLIVQKKTYFKILLFLNFILSFTALLLTYSRGGWITFILSICIFLFLEKDKLKENISYLIWLFLFSSAILIISSQRKVMIDNRITNIPGRIKSLTDIHYPSFEIRRHLWHDAILMIRERPVIGWGLNTFTTVFPKFRSPELSYLAGKNNLPENPHNDYLNISANSGFLGLFSFLFFSIVILKYSFKKVKEGVLYSGIFSVIFGFLFQSIFYYKIVPTSTLFFILSGIVLSKKREFFSFKIDFFHKPTIFLLYFFVVILTFYFVTNSLFEILANKYYRKGMSYLTAHRYIEAEREFLKAQIFSPFNRDYKLGLGSVYEEMAIHISKKDKDSLNLKKFLFEKGIKEYRDTIKIFKNDPYSYASLGRIYFHYSRINKKYFKNSKENYKIAQKLDPKNCVFYHDLGVLYLIHKEYESAEKEFEKAIKLNPHYAEAFENLGMSYYYSGDKEKAIFYLKKAIEEENLYSAYIRIVMILIEMERRKEAIEYLKKAEKIFPQEISIKKLLEGLQKNNGKRK